ncbi:hypothetical protein Zm00014a_033694 [Zea mays]|uniref:Uncharacterized protein n=1 Tax=Zea mays TaxID=4577 RepID=A0A3L6G2Y9_MAIZE|nr:hypothetical protein Zm00014a_033694 [Zea mays]
MASNKKPIAATALLFLAVALTLAASVRAQALLAPTPAPAPSQNPCPAGFNNLLAFGIAKKEFLLNNGTMLLLFPSRGTQSTTSMAPSAAKGVRSVVCICFLSTNRILIGGPLTCQQLV